MERQYFRKKDPNETENIEWIQMSGKEFYQFIKSPEGRKRYFVAWKDLVLEVSQQEYADWRREKDHSGYLWEQEKLRTIVSLNGKEIEEYGDGLDVISDPAADVEARVSRKKKIQALRDALLQLDTDSYRLIYALYLSDCRQTERQLAQELGISQSAVHKRKKKILKNLKFLVIKFEKSSQQESERGT